MKVTEFNNRVCSSFANDLQLELNKLTQKYGLNSIKIENGGKFTDASFTFKVTARTCEKAADPFFQKQQQRFLSQLGLPDNSIGRRFESLGETFQFDRIDPKKWKMPVIAYKVVGGKVTDRGYKFSAETVKKYFETHGA